MVAGTGTVGREAFSMLSLTATATACRRLAPKAVTARGPLLISASSPKWSPASRRPTSTPSLVSTTAGEGRAGGQEGWKGGTHRACAAARMRASADRSTAGTEQHHLPAKPLSQNPLKIHPPTDSFFHHIELVARLALLEAHAARLELQQAQRLGHHRLVLLRGGRGSEGRGRSVSRRPGGFGSRGRAGMRPPGSQRAAAAAAAAPTQAHRRQHSQHGHFLHDVALLRRRLLLVGALDGCVHVALHHPQLAVLGGGHCGGAGRVVQQRQLAEAAAG